MTRYSILGFVSHKYERGPVSLPDQIHLLLRNMLCSLNSRILYYLYPLSFKHKHLDTPLLKLTLFLFQRLFLTIYIILCPKNTYVKIKAIMTKIIISHFSPSFHSDFSLSLAFICIGLTLPILSLLMSFCQCGIKVEVYFSYMSIIDYLTLR